MNKSAKRIKIILVISGRLSCSAFKHFRLSKTKVVPENFDDSPCCLPISIGIRRSSHSAICRRTVKEMRSFYENLSFIKTNELHGTRFNRLGSLCHLTKYQNRLTQRRSFFLDTTRVCQNEIAFVH